MSKFDDLTIADLKAAYDFTLIDLEMLKDKAEKEGILVDQIGAYPEVSCLENRLFHELLCRVRGL